MAEVVQFCELAIVLTCPLGSVTVILKGGPHGNLLSMRR